MKPQDKIVPFSSLPGILRLLRKKGKKVVHCHGTFDLLHPGHLVHFEEAKACGDILVVTLTGEKFVNKGPGRPYFSDSLRARSLAALSSVDLVSVVPHPHAKEAILAVRPSVYCKGREYAEKGKDTYGRIDEDLATVRSVGGKVAFVGSVVFSSSKLLNDHFDNRSDQVKNFCQSIRRHTSASDFRRQLENFASLRVLVVGDLIFDRYTSVAIQGLTSKNRIISGRFLDDDLQAGGSLAVFRHIQQFCPQTKILGIVGTEGWVGEFLRDKIGVSQNLLVRGDEFTSIVKQRFVEPFSEGKELSKLFSVNYLNEGEIGPDLEKKVLQTLAREIPKADLVLVMDFGHGLMTEKVRRYVEKHARLLAINCQTNSNNFAFNILNRRYQRADIFALDTMEICLAAGNRRIDFAQELAVLRKKLKSRYGWLTRGGVETIGIARDGELAQCEALERTVLDTVGAGDAFISVAALAAARNLPLDLATLMGQLAGANAVRIVGNSRPISKSSVLKGGMSLLS
jgi:cytidyltransferase-like protein